MDDQERGQLVQAVVDQFEARGAVQGVALLDLMRVEQNLQDSLNAVRRMIDAHVRAAAAEGSGV
jgi:hypothetical protein